MSNEEPFTAEEALAAAEHIARINRNNGEALLARPLKEGWEDQLLPGMPEAPELITPGAPVFIAKEGNKYEPLPRLRSPWNAPAIESVEDAVELAEAIIREMAPFPETVTVRLPADLEDRLVFSTHDDADLTAAEVAKAGAIAAAFMSRVSQLDARPRMPQLLLVLDDRAVVHLWGNQGKVCQLLDEPRAS